MRLWHFSKAIKETGRGIENYNHSIRKQWKICNKKVFKMNLLLNLFSSLCSCKLPDPSPFLSVYACVHFYLFPLSSVFHVFRVLMSSASHCIVPQDCIIHGLLASSHLKAIISMMGWIEWHWRMARLHFHVKAHPARSIDPRKTIDLFTNVSQINGCFSLGTMVTNNFINLYLTMVFQYFESTLHT